MQGAAEEVKAVVGELSELRYRMATDKPFTPIATKRADAEAWAQAIDASVRSPPLHPWHWAPS